MRRYLSVFLFLATLMLLGSVRAETPALPPSPEPGVNPRYFFPAVEHLDAKPRSQLSNRLVPATMSEGFEGAWPSDGWQLADQSDTDGGEYLWGKRDCHPRTGSYAGLCVGGGAQGSAMACGAVYPNNLDTWAVYGPFSLAGASSATLTFYLYGESEGGSECEYDYLSVGGSSNGENFESARACGDWREGPDGQGYTLATFNLDTWLGQSQVWVAFHFVSDDSYVFSGLTIDDVSLNVSGGATTPTPTETPGSNRTHRLQLPLVMRPRPKESLVERVGSSQGGIVTTRSGFQLNIPPEAVPFRQGGSDYEVAFSIETGVVPPAPVPSWAQRTDATVKFGPDGFVFAYPIAMQLPIPQVPDLAQLSLLRYHADQGKWLRMPMAFSGDRITSVSASAYDLGYTALVVSPPAPAEQTASASVRLTEEMWWYDGALRISHENASCQQARGTPNYWLVLKSFTPKYAEQAGWAYVPGTVLRTGTTPDSSPAEETVWFMLQGTYVWCLSATEWLPPPMEGTKKFMYADVITTVINQPSHNTCQVSPCWTNVVEIPVLDPSKWSETQPCVYNPGFTLPVGTGEFQTTLSWANTEGAATDLDLHLYGPNGIEVYYDNKRSPDGSLELDRDAREWHPGHVVENIYSLAPMPAGNYRLEVVHYYGAPKSFTVRTIHGAVVKTYSGRLEQADQLVTIETFTR